MNKLKIVQGTDNDIPVYWFYRDSKGVKVDIDITGSSITYLVRNHQEDADLISVTVITHENPAAGETIFPLTAAQTGALAAGKTYWWIAQKTQDGKISSTCWQEMEVCRGS